MNYRPIRNQILVRPPPPTERVGKIHVPAGYKLQGNLRRGEVLAVGPEVRHVKAGAFILYEPAYGTNEFEAEALGPGKFIQLPEPHVLALIDPKAQLGMLGHGVRELLDR